jgi:cysteine desulfurase
VLTRLICLDHAAASPVDPRVLEAMLPYFAHEYGNPQSLYALGSRARDAVETAREQVAGLLGAAPGEITFTASGTESNNLAIKGLVAANRGKGGHIVASTIEHASVTQPIRALEKQGLAVTWLPVNREGLVDPEALKSSLRPDTILATVVTASNEIGTIEPVAELGRICREAGVLFHTDAVAAAGAMPVSVRDWHADALSLSAQSFYGPRGAAALYVRKGVRLQPQLEGGVQQDSRRAGSENVPAIVGMGRAAALAVAELADRSEHLRRLRDRVIDELPRRLERVYLTGSRTQRLVGQASFLVEFIEGEGMLLFLDDAGIMAASGSACTSRSLKVSPVLVSLGYDHALAQGSLMLTLGTDNTADDIEYFLAQFPPIVARLRQMSPLYARYLKNPAAYDTGQSGSKECIVPE